MKKRVKQDSPMDTTDLFILSKIRNTSFQDIIKELSTQRINLDEQKLLFKIKEKVLKGYPLAYILERIDFLNREFYINSNVLVPRPETEEWVSNFINFFRAKHEKNLDSKFNLIDMATGSGVIGISTWLELGLSLDTIYLVDISQSALDVAKINLNHFKQNYSSNSNIKLIGSDLFSDFTDSQLSVFQKKENHNIFLSNLPYLPYLDKADLPNLDYEPEIALFSGQKGLDLFLKTIEQIIDKNLHFDLLYFELDPRNVYQAQELLLKYNYFSKYNIKVLIDFMGRSRTLVLDIMY